MSKVNKKCFYIFAILILFSFFAFGCKSTSTPVEHVDFDLNETGGQISLLVGDEYSPKIDFVPSFATNQNYRLTSSDEEVLKISAQKIVAAKSGQAYLTVIADDNNAIQNTILVNVYNQPTKLGGEGIDSAINLQYSAAEQKFVFSEIPNAAGYTININGEDIPLNHAINYSLDEYGKMHSAYDTVLTAKVRADAPNYSHAFSSSDFCSEIKIYQVSAVKNVKIESQNGQSSLSFEHDIATNFDILINGESQAGWQNISDKTISLMNLPEKFAGQNVSLQIKALINEDVTGSFQGVDCQPALSQNYYVNVLAVPKLSLNASTVVWNAIPFASGYEIFVDNVKQATTTTCSYNLNDLQNIVAGEEHALRVEPILTGGNLAKTNKLCEDIKVSKNAAPEFTIENETLKWDVADNKNYFVEVYKNDLLVENFATTNAEFALDFVQDGVYKISVCELAKTEGDVYYLTSEKTTMQIARLKTPTLAYKKGENKFEILDENSEENIAQYLLTFSGGRQEFENKNLDSFSCNFEVGANVFGLTAIAKGEVDGVNYLNSKPYNLTINKIKNISKISISNEDFDGGNFFNCLKVETGLEQEYKLNLTLTINDNSINLLTENGALKDGKHNYVLPYVFDGGNYYIALLNADYSLIIDKLKNGEQTTATFNLSLILESDLENEISSDTIDATFPICGKTSVVGVGQKIIITKVNPASLIEDYYLLINNNLLVNLTSDLATVENENVVVDFAVLAEKLATEKIDLTKQIDIKVLNTYANSLLAVSDNFNCALAETPTITATKNVDVDSATEIAINVSKTDYTKQYIFKIYNEDKSVDEILTFDDAADAKFYLEKWGKYKNFENEIYVSAYVSVLKQAEDSVYYFNSLQTQALKFNKLQPVSNLKISNGILSFENTNENVAFFEIYSVVTDLYTKLGTTSSTSFDLTKIEISEKFNLAVVAVPNVEFNTTPEYTNSDYSEPISAQKVGFNLTVDNGDFVITVPQLTNLQPLFEASDGSRAYLKVENLNNQKTFVFSAGEQDAIVGLNIDFENNQIKLESYLILNYGEQVAIENLTFQIVVEYAAGSEPESLYCINSAVKNISVSGLIKPNNLNVKYATGENDETIDFIDWNNEKNPRDFDYGYVLKLTYKGETYSSLDGTFESNGKPIDFDGNKIKLPTKFTKNGSAPVEFSEGEYILQIKIYPLSKTPTSTYCSSNYATAKIEILSTPNFSIRNGNLMWARNGNEQGYQIKITQGDQTIFVQTTDTQFSFDSNALTNLSGVLSVQIQAISKIKNETDLDILKSVANSRWSEKLLVYKLRNLQGASVDDGTLILTANKFFNTAEIEFICDGISTMYVYDNSEYASSQLSSLDIENWENLPSEKSELLNQIRRYIIDLNVADKYGNKISLIDGATYSIFVKLTGNDVGNLPIVCSSKTSPNINLTSIKTVDAKATERGKLNFTIDADFVLDDFNYNFNESAKTLSAIDDLKARVYKIDITVADKSYSILALDYNYFAAKINSLTEEDYHLYGGANNTLYGYLKLNSNGQEIYLNVYENNILDFNQQTIYYNKIDISTDTENGKFNYSMEDKNLAEINISTGGNFVVDVSLLGGDSTAQIANLTSPKRERYFVRYVENALSTSKGELRFKDLTPLDSNGNPLDYPIYKIVASSVSGYKNFYLYYADSNLQEVKNLVADDGATFVKIKDILLEDNVNYVWFEISNYLDNATSYNLTIQTLAGLGTDDNAKYLLNAYKQSENYGAYKYDFVDYEIDKNVGVRLNFDTNDSRYEIYEYEITLIDTKTSSQYIYSIDRASENVKMINGKLLYTLPTTINIGGEDVELNSTYKFKIRARAKDDASGQALINGSYKDESSFTIRQAEEIGDFSIENGALKFATPKEAQQVYLQISYEDGVSKNLYFIYNINSNLDYQIYNFSDNPIYKNELNLDTEAIVANKNYKINLFALGFEESGNYVLNGNFIVEDLDLIRLASVNHIFARDGVLTWDEIEGAVGYKILVDDRADLDLTSKQNSLDISEQLAAGQYNISIIALGNEQINARASVEVRLDKLEKVTQTSIKLTENLIIWQSVENADRYYYEFAYTQNGEPVVVKNYATDAQCEVPVGLNGQFTFKVQAQKQGESTTLNSQFESFTSSILVPNSLSGLEWQADKYAFKITTSDDFGENDKIEITCSVNKYIYNGSVSLSSQIEMLTYQIEYNKGNNGIYYFYPSVMGKYSVVSARVRRGGILSSGSMAHKDLDLHLFSAGDGDSTPYSIAAISPDLTGPTPAQQLLNIKYRPDAKFVLEQSVDLSLAKINNYDGILANEFGGELDGNGFAIKGYEASVNNSNFSLFKTLNGATINNLILGDEQEIAINASYTSSPEIYLAVLAQISANSEIKKVTINKTNISVSGSASSGVYVASLIAKAQNTKILGCKAEVTINYQLGSNVKSKYVGGLVAAADGGEFGTNGSEKTTVNFTLISTNQTDADITYLGGLVGAYQSQSTSMGKINEVEVTVNMAKLNARNAGGLVGLSRCNDIINCVAKGSISTAKLSSQTSVNLAGLVGTLQSSNIDGCKNEIAITVDLGTDAAQNENIRIGILVGEISVGEQDHLSSIKNCQSNVEFANGQTVLGSNRLGIYGYLTQGTVSGNIECQKV